MAKSHGWIGEVKHRFQVYNPKTKRWTKASKDSGRFMDQSSKKAKPFKGVRKIKKAKKK